MTDKEINQKVAALCGWKQSKKHKWWLRNGVVRLNPPYTESLDMCRDFIKEINGGDRDVFCTIVLSLERVEHTYVFVFWWALLTLTPRELCEAYLKLKGQWDEN